jgi:DNA-binding MarR family transcriptional regulator
VRRSAIPLAAELKAGPSAEALRGIMGHRLRRLQTLFVAHWGRWFQDLEPAITPVQGGILLLIEANPGLSQIALARLLRIEAPTLIQALTPLIEAGLVERFRPASDRRVFALHLSRVGRAMAEVVRAGAAAHEADLLRRLAPSERRLLADLLDKALASGEDALRRAGETVAAEPAEETP